MNQVNVLSRNSLINLSFFAAITSALFFSFAASSMCFHGEKVEMTKSDFVKVYPQHANTGIVDGFNNRENSVTVLTSVEECTCEHPSDAPVGPVVSDPVVEACTELGEGCYLESGWNDQISNAQVSPAPVYVYDPLTEEIWAGFGYNDRESNVFKTCIKDGSFPGITKGSDLIVVTDVSRSGWNRGSHIYFRNVSGPDVFSDFTFQGQESTFEGGYNDRD